MKLKRSATHIVYVVLAALAAHGVAAATPAEHQTAEPPEVTIRRYLHARASLNAVRTLSPAQIVAVSPPTGGQIVEFAGKITGRTIPQGRDRAALCFLLRPVGADEEVFVDAAEDSPLISLGTLVHVLGQRSGDGDTRYALRGIVRTLDLPEDEWWEHARPREPVPALEQVCRMDLNPIRDGLVVPAPAANTPQASSQPEVEQVEPPARPGTEFPDVSLWGTDQRVTVWMQWVAKRNSKLTDAQCRLIVESVLYYSYRYSIDHRLAFAMIRYESNFNPRCKSHAGAMGLTQLMPGTARYMGVRDPWDIQQNIMGGIRYLSEQLYSFAGRSHYEQTILGLAAYNAGPGAVKRAGGVPNYTETQNYVKRVSALFLQFHEDGMP